MVKAPFHRGEPWRPDPPAARQLEVVVQRTTSAFTRKGLPIFLLSSLLLTPASAQESSRPKSNAPTKVAMGSALAQRDRDIMHFVDPGVIFGGSPDRLDPLTGSECRAEPVAADPAVAIQEFPDPVYVHTLSKAEISALENEVSGQGREAAGLTLILAGSVQTHSGEVQAPSGASCVVIDGVKVLPMKEVTVYIASEYPVGGCNYNAVIRHEEKHVAIARRLVGEYRLRLSRVLGELSLKSRGFPALAEDRSGSTGSIAADVQSAVQGVINELKAAIQNANRLLDEGDNQRTLNQCPSW